MTAELHDAKPDADGDCTVCGLPWASEADTLEPHQCPPGFTSHLAVPVSAETFSEIVKVLQHTYDFVDDSMRAPKVKHDKAKLLEEIRSVLAKVRP